MYSYVTEAAPQGASATAPDDHGTKRFAPELVNALEAMLVGVPRKVRLVRPLQL